MIYLSNHWTDLPQILNLDIFDLTKFDLQMFQFMTIANGRRLRILKVISLSNYWSELLQLLNLTLAYVTKQHLQIFLMKVR